jgi:hypothetical protein
MSCCGSRRAALRSQQTATGSVVARHWTAGAMEIEYLGPGSLTVTGPATGAVYQFAAPRSRVRVHGADAPSLISMPGLRAVQ